MLLRAGVGLYKALNLLTAGTPARGATFQIFFAMKTRRSRQVPYQTTSICLDV
jgi:hypothetical protein